MAELTTINEQVYNAQEDTDQTPAVETVICVLMQRCIFMAGFDNNEELLTIHTIGYSADKAVWDLDFFEQIVAQEPLLAAKEKVKAIFIASDRNLVVPEELYDEVAAKSWIKRIHFIEQNDTIETSSVANDKTQYLYAVPLSITALIKINFKKATILPLPLYHFQNIKQQSLYLKCCIGNEQVCATLHNYSQLLWHRIFDYSCAEDIAYEIKHLCMENNISPSKISLVCNATGAVEYETITALTQYYGGIKCGDGSPLGDQWAPAISLAKQLLSCV